MTFTISVDVAAAVRALTERTRPSLAFDVVRVVRRALALGATRVDVACAADRFTVRCHGAAMNRDELALIETVLAGADDDRAGALLALEEQHSLALLAVLTTAARAEVHGPVTIAAERGCLVPSSAASGSSVSTIVVWRDGHEGRAKDERKELARWCRHADAPVVVDGHRVDKPFRLPDARGVRMVRGPGGRAIVGIVDDPAHSRVVLYSYGVYVGVRPRPRGSLPLVAHVSVRAFGPEDDTRLAVHAADIVIAAAEARLLAAVAGAFASMPRAERRAIREALLDSDGRTWSSELVELPLFDAVGAPFSLTLRGLRDAGVVPAASHARGHLPGTPLLDTRTRAFLVRTLGDVVRPAITARGAWWARRVGHPRVVCAAEASAVTCDAR